MAKEMVPRKIHNLGLDNVEYNVQTKLFFMKVKGLNGTKLTPKSELTHHGSDLGEATDFLSRDPQVGVPKLSRLGLLRLWGAITFRVDL
jgi:hypothetical protein